MNKLDQTYFSILKSHARGAIAAGRVVGGEHYDPRSARGKVPAHLRESIKKRTSIEHATTTNFAEAKKELASINAEVSSASEQLQRFPRSPIGLPSDEVRLSPEYRAAKAAFDRAFVKLRNFNEIYVKKFAKELRAERNKRYGR